MPLIDVHSHLDIIKDLDSVIKRAKQADVKAIITAGLNKETNRKTIEISQKYDIVKASLGIYPTDNLEGVDEETEWIKKQDFIAIGEVGLDYQELEDRKNQKIIFEKFIELAEKTKKPIIIHSRKAEKDVVDMIESSRLKKVILHCFCGAKSLIKKAADNNYFFSIPCIITRSQQFQELVKEVELKQLLTETDAPYLSPFQGKRNEPAFIVETIKKIAEIKRLSIEGVEEQIFNNAKKLFNIK